MADDGMLNAEGGSLRLRISDCGLKQQSAKGMEQSVNKIEFGRWEICWRRKTADAAWHCDSRN
jgi:hypothetical protein